MSARGSAWEARLESWHALYRQRKIAWIVKTGAQFRILAGGKTAEIVGEGPPDYVGALSDGRAFAADAKDCTQARWPLSRLPVHQARALHLVSELGGVSGILLRLQGEGWWIPWASLAPRWQAWSSKHPGAPASLTLTDCREIGRPIGAGGWVEVVRG